MNGPLPVTMLVLASCVISCGEAGNPPEAAAPDNRYRDLQVMDQSLERLKQDFNANTGRVRLMFLSGPTCGICLRGMADLNDAFLAANQHDDRLVTFMVHVPTMGAKEKHVGDTIPLLEGPRIHHYWEPSGIIGRLYSDVMGVPMYVWDFWAIYGPDARWDGDLPPEPAYYEHQLGVTAGGSRGFPRERVLDAERFASKTFDLVGTVDASRFAAETHRTASESELLADGTEISVVGQPRDVAVRQHIMGRGGYMNLKRIRSVQAAGSLHAGNDEYALTITANRPNDIRRKLTRGDRVSVAERHGETVDVDASGDRGLPREIETLLLEAFEFDGLFVEWGDKGHEVSMRGMRKIDDVLAWRLELKQRGQSVWTMYVDSHSGDLVQMELLDDSGDPSLVIRQGEFKVVSGFRFPHRVQYLTSGGELIALETYDSIRIDIVDFELGGQTITH